jgi:hypothetical protein
VEGADIFQGVGAAEREGDNVIDLPSVIRLYAVVRAPDGLAEIVDPPLVEREAAAWAAARPSGDLLLFRPRESV